MISRLHYISQPSADGSHITSIKNALAAGCKWVQLRVKDQTDAEILDYATQAAVKPPTFILFVNDPELMHFSYERYIENKIRDAFVFEGTPVRILTRKKT